MSYKIKFPFLWESINEKDDNVDVCIELENGQQYVLVIATPDINAKGFFTIFKTGASFSDCRKNYRGKYCWIG